MSEEDLIRKQKIEAFREKAQERIIDNLKEYHSAITYISAGALAFFLTFNEKFIAITSAKLKVVLLISIICLLVSLFMSIIINRTHGKMYEDLTGFIDTMDKSSAEGKKALDELWYKLSIKAIFLNRGRIGLLIAGVAAEIIFLGYNVYYNGGKPIDEKWSVEIKVDKDSILKGKSVTVYFNPADSSNNNNNGSKEKSSR